MRICSGSVGHWSITACKSGSETGVKSRFLVSRGGVFSDSCEEKPDFTLGSAWFGTKRSQVRILSPRFWPQAKIEQVILEQGNRRVPARWDWDKSVAAASNQDATCGHLVACSPVRIEMKGERRLGIHV